MRLRQCSILARIARVMERMGACQRARAQGAFRHKETAMPRLTPSSGISDLRDDRRPESTLSLIRYGYQFVARRTSELDASAFQTRLALQPTIVLTGADAARAFYDTSQVQRSGALPRPLQDTLFGHGGVQHLDGEEHRHRKAMHMSLMTEPEIARLASICGAQFEAFAERWMRQPRVVLLDEAHELLCRASCEWTGVPLPESEIALRTSDLVMMVEGPGKPDWRHLRARLALQRSRRWAAGLVRAVREEEDRAEAEPPFGALRTIAWHRDQEGELLDESVAAEELLNNLRPTVAVARWFVFLAVALHTHEGARERLASGEWEPDWFIEEVRRFYPFFPALIGRTRHEFEWHGWRLPGGRRVMVDVFGTNRDPERWEEPHRFRPERFRDREVDPFEFIPQGGGDYFEGHRCSGEWATLAMMRVALDFLVHRVRYDVPPQDMRILLRRMPGQPESGFIMSNVRRT